MTPPLDDAERAHLRREAEAGDPEAWFALGLDRWHAGGPNRVPLAREAFQAAAREGHVEAQYWLARAIRAGARTPGLRAAVVATETERAFYWLEQAAERGCVAAMEELAGLGRERPARPAEAAAWLDRAAAAGSERAAARLRSQASPALGGAPAAASDPGAPDPGDAPALGGDRAGAARTPGGRAKTQRRRG